jgi:RNA polymerase sigma-70 factor (ECF subfamily)
MAARNEIMERRLFEGDLEALRWLVETYQDAMVRLGWRLFRRAPEAQDFAQDVFVRVFEKRRQYNPNRPLQPWLYAVAINLGRERMRKQREFPAGDDLPEGSVKPEAEDQLLREEQKQQVLKALQELQSRYREVLALWFESGLSLAEIAQVLGVPLGTVKSRLSRGLEEFHAVYQRRERSVEYERA